MNIQQMAEAIERLGKPILGGDDLFSAALAVLKDEVDRTMPDAPERERELLSYERLSVFAADHVPGCMEYARLMSYAEAFELWSEGKTLRDLLEAR